MRIRLFAFVAVALVLPVASQGQEKIDNPFKNAKVGDYLTYKMTMSFMGKDSEASVKETVSAKNDKELTLKSVSTFMGKALPKKDTSPDTKIDLTKPYDPLATFFKDDKKAKFEKTGEGKEKIKVGEKTYECNWLAGKATTYIGELKAEMDLKFWFSKSVPLTGMVKLEMKADMVNMQFELTDSGSSKEKIDNPFKNAKVGDYCAYKITTTAGKDIKVDSGKETVTAKSDTEVSLKSAGSNETTKIDLTKSYDPIASTIQVLLGKKGKFEKTSEGKEKIKVGDKTYDCNWIAGKDVREATLGPVEIKVWFSKSVPLTGIVKIEMKSKLVSMQVELTESGSSK